ncbi:MAG: DUF6011 domain-containing protein [Candidatus Woesearchaeota archaeon]
MKRCRRCNRILKTEESKNLGYGKVCYKKIKNDKSKRLDKYGIR